MHLNCTELRRRLEVSQKLWNALQQCCVMLENLDPTLVTYSPMAEVSRGRNCGKTRGFSAKKTGTSVSAKVKFTPEDFHSLLTGECIQQSLICRKSLSPPFITGYRASNARHIPLAHIAHRGFEEEVENSPATSSNFVLASKLFDQVEDEGVGWGARRRGRGLLGSRDPPDFLGSQGNSAGGLSRILRDILPNKVRLILCAVYL